MKWIKCSDRLPFIQETLEITDGHRIFKAYAWDSVHGGVYFEPIDEEWVDFIPIWWRASDDSALCLVFDEYTFEPKINKRKDS